MKLSPSALIGPSSFRCSRRNGWGRWGAVLFVVFGGWVAAWAADKSGVSPTAISLPKGPGSIEGLGESFQPALNSGQAQYSVPLKLPAGPAGRAPALALRYEGGGGNGVLGPGWSLPVPLIQRRSDHGLPTYGEPVGFERDDTYINEAREELVPRGDGYFLSKNEGAFVRYEFQVDHWVGTRPDGTRMEFGRTPQGRIADAGRIYAWLLERVVDTRGNEERYHYVSFPGVENQRQRYLQRIEYGAGGPPWAARHFVQLDYEDRPDPTEDARAGFVVGTGKRLRAISVATQGIALPGHQSGDVDGDGTSDSLNRRYLLEYLAEAAAVPPVSLLTQVAMVGADGITPLPPLQLGYGVCRPAARLDAVPGIVVSSNEPPAVMDNPLVEFLDVNGDGLPDLIKTDSAGGAHQAFLNEGETTSLAGRSVRWSDSQEVDAALGAAWNFHLGQNETHLADMDGDGLADLVHQTATGSAFYFLNRGDVGWGLRQELDTSGTPPPAPFGRTDVRTGDFDFDKRIDIIQSLPSGGGFDYRIWFNLGLQTYSPPITVAQESGYSLADPTVQIADLNGDRVPDIARVRPAVIELTLGLGYGRFDARKVLVLPDGPLTDDQVNRAKLTDLNGDGLADLVIERAAPGECWYWLNGDHGQFAEHRVIENLPASVAQNAAIRWADLNGNGSVDLVYADRESDRRLVGFDLASLFACAPAPNLLVGITNGLGRITSIAYESSTRYLLEDKMKGIPWPDRVPFPVTVVAAVTTDDSLGHLYVTRFQYHNGYYDPVEKQFRGFARVDQIEVGDTNAPTLVTTYDFDTGRTDEAMKGKIHRKRIGTAAGALFSEDTFQWATPAQVLGTAPDGREIRFAYPIGDRRDLVELGKGTTRRMETSSTYDVYGNRTRFAEHGLVEAGDRSAGNDERITLTEYALNTNAWILRLPRRTSVRDFSGKTISRSEFFYDDETFSAQEAPPTIGNLTLERQWKSPDDANSAIAARRAKFDAYGNPIMELDPLGVAPGGVVDLSRGHVRLMDFDPVFRAEVVRERAYAGNEADPLEVTAEYDLGLGTLLASTDFNGHRSEFRFDPLGRLQALIRPGDSDSFPGLEYEYRLAVPLSGGGVVSYVETRELDRSPGEVPGDRVAHYRVSRQYTDGLGRSLMTRSEAESEPGSPGSRVVVTGARRFNARQQSFEVLQPFFASGSGSLSDLLAFESIEASSWRGRFERGGTSELLPLAAAPRTITRHDAQLRPVEMTNPDGTRQRTEYEPLLIREFDENDADPASPHRETPRVRVQDGLNRLIEVREIARLTDDGLPVDETQARSSRYRYDANSQLVSATDPFGNERKFFYDGLRRRIRLEDPDQGTLTITLDDASNIRETQDGKGQRSLFTYDGLNRRLTEQRLDGRALPGWRAVGSLSAEVIYHYDIPAPGVDQGDGTVATAQNTRGRLAWVEDRSGEEHTSFDSRGRVVWVVKRVPMDLQSGGELASFRSRFEYDPADRLSGVGYPDGDHITYQHSPRGLIASVSGGQVGSILQGLTYSPAGHASALTYGNGCRTQYQYDDRLRITRIQVRPPVSAGAGAGPLLDLGYQFDPAANILAVHDLRSAQDLPSGDARRNHQSFRYDDLNRLTEASYSFATAPSGGGANPDTERLQYRYDAVGNLLEQRGTPGLTGVDGQPVDLGALSYGGAGGRRGRSGRRVGDSPGPHALTSVQRGSASGGEVLVPYDGNGNVTRVDATVLTWDFKDRLIAAENAEMRAEYVYDYSDRRIVKQVLQKLSGPASLRVVHTIDQYFELREGHQPVKHVWLGNNRMARSMTDLNSSVRGRVQRVPLRAGWNVFACQLSGRWQPGAGSIVPDQALIWNRGLARFEPLQVGDPMPSGAVVWVHTRRAGIWSLAGESGPEFTGQWGAGPDFVPVPLTWTQSTLAPDGSSVWIFDPETQEWRTWSSGPEGLVSDTAVSRLPWWRGQAAFVRWPQAVDWPMPTVEESTVYYHADHLGSSTVLTDARGGVIEERAYYPFGVERQAVLKRGQRSPYGFSQKEVDAETGLTYFESRYFSSAWARFLRTDPLLTTVKEDWLTDPQNANPYAYCKNRPLNCVDPDGMEPISLGGGFKLDPLAPSLSFARGPFSASADTGTGKVAYDFGKYKADLLFNYNLSGGGGLMSKEGGLRFNVDFKTGNFTLSPSTPWLNMNFGYNPQTKAFSFGASTKIDKLSLSAGLSTDKSFSASVSYGAPLVPFATSDSFSKSIYDAEGAGRDLLGLAGRFQGNPIDFYNANKDQITGGIDKVKAGVGNVQKVTAPMQFGAGFQIQGSSSTGVSGILGGQVVF
ncbi:MAG: VCBS repeat-containing protein [Verrucomicrobiales bacterium]|nr:VCBS repeat-containing protein [Verrucomicrobiales bacterium]